MKIAFIKILYFSQKRHAYKFNKMNNLKKPNNKNDADIQCLYLIENQVQEKTSHPGMSSFCPCSICTNDHQLKEKGKAFLRQTSSILKIDLTKMQEFFGLMTAVDSKTYIRIDIPEICFFFKGEIRRIFKSNNAGIHQVEVTPNLKKSLANFFLDQKKTTMSKKEALDISQEMKSQTHIKHFSDMVPSYKHGRSIDEKQPKNFIFHKNSQYDQQMSINAGKLNSEEACIVKYKDKAFELINQKQLKQLLSSLVSLKNVEFIQKYIRPNEKEEEFFYGNYNMYKALENGFMFNRSLMHIKLELNLINVYSRDYVPVEHLEDYEQLLKDIPQEYCLYQTYKMIHYMELVKDVKIEKISTVWLKDESKEICFFGLMDFDWQENENITVDVTEIKELKELVSTELTDFEGELLKAWESMKERKKKVDVSKQIDEKLEAELEKIKMESSMRLEKKKRKFSKKI